MSNEVNKGRRSALKKLGLTTGAVYVAPAVTALVVPQHATATSSSSGGTTPTSTSTVDTFATNGITIQEWKTHGLGFTYILTVSTTGLDLTSATVTIGGVSYGTLSSMGGNWFSMNPTNDGSMVAGNSYQIVLGKSGSNYTKTATLVAF